MVIYTNYPTLYTSARAIDTNTQQVTSKLNFVYHKGFKSYRCHFVPLPAYKMETPEPQEEIDKFWIIELIKAIAKLIHITIYGIKK